jgi:hypothetical protein
MDTINAANLKKIFFIDKQICLQKTQFYALFGTFFRIRTAAALGQRK